MKNKRPSSRRSRLEKETAELRKLAFRTSDESVPIDPICLEIERDNLVRARVLLDCAMVEEAMALIIMNYVLADCPKWHQIKYFGRIKKYRVFYDHILGRLPARHKTSVVKKFIRLPKGVSKTLDRMLALRDVFAHVYTLDYSKTRDLEYKGQRVLSIAGFESYLRDSTEVVEFFARRANIL